MGSFFLLVLVLGGVLLLPGLWMGRMVARRCGLGTMGVLTLGVVFSMALIPLALYDACLLIPLHSAFGFSLIVLVLAAVGVGLLCRRGDATTVDSPSDRPPVFAGDHRLKGGLALILLYVAVVAIMPFARDGEVRNGQVLWNWIDDVQLEQGIVNGILLFGLPGQNIFIATDAPIGFHHFAMIFKAVPVFLTGHRLDPHTVLLVVNMLAAVLFVGMAALLLRQRFSWSATLFGILAMIFLSGYDAIPSVMRTDVAPFPQDPLGQPVRFMPDGWAELEKLRILTPYAYMIWQARHLVAVCFFLVILLLVWRRERAPVRFGLLAGFLMASMVGYSIPLALNTVIALALLFVWIFASDIPRRQATPALAFCGAGAAAGLAGLPFVWTFLRDGQDAGVFLRFPEREALKGVFLVDYGPLLLFAAAGLRVAWRRRTWKTLDAIVMIPAAVTGILVLTIRRTLGSIVHHNDFGLTTAIVVTLGLTYAAAGFHEYRNPVWQKASAFARPRVRLATELGFLGAVWALCAALHLSILYVAVGVAMVAVLEGLIRLEVWPFFRLWPCWLVALFVSVVTHVCDVKGHATVNEPFSADTHRALRWVGEHTAPDAVVQSLPVWEESLSIASFYIPAIAAKRLYIGGSSGFFAPESLFNTYVHRIDLAWTEEDEKNRWRALDCAGVDFLLMRRPFADRYADPALFEVVYRSGDDVVIRVRHQDE